MSLSARFAIGPSRRVAGLSTALAAGGVCVAASTACARWPDAAGPVIGAAVVVALAAGLAFGAIYRAATPQMLTVSDRDEIDVAPGTGPGGEGAWRLVDGTLAWPGFSMLALGRGRERLQVPVFADALTAPDRRALGRFLRWSLRNGGTRAVGASRN